MLALELLWFKTRKRKLQVGSAMWIEKLSCGVLRVLTPLGPRYIEPTFRQRIYLLWIFRNFQTLPPQVLRPWQQRLIDGLCAEQRFTALPQLNGLEDAPIIGTLERRPPIEVEALPARRASAVVTDAVARS
ncbi:MAG: hypothetical protein LAN63_06530 [Acidobacteriia bacterium]|nr:hypothetical protein [Terriglobia bacterium]